MAKGQQRGNRETKKPKQPPKTTPPTSPAQALIKGNAAVSSDGKKK